jgi:hypothetical protein
VSTRANVLIFLGTAVAVGYVFWLVRLDQLRSKYALLWTVSAAALLPLAAFPSLLEEASDIVGIDYAPSTFFLAAIAFLFLVVVHFSWELSRLESKVRTLAEELALLRTEVEGDDARPDHEPDAP